MKIAAHIVLTKDSTQNYLSHWLQLMAAKHPAYSFLFFSLEAFDGSEHIPENTKIHYLHPRYRNKVWLNYWYRYKLPAFLKKNQTDIFISEVGMISEKIKIPQYIFLNAPQPGISADLMYSQYPYRNRRNFLGNAREANKIFSSTPAAALLFSHLKHPQPIEICLPGLPAPYQIHSWEENQEIIRSHAGDENFFLYVVTENTKANAMLMLKAFSLFKKWQRSSMKLMLLLHSVEQTNLIPDFHLYKYREDVIFKKFESHEQAAPLFSAAYLQIYLPENFADENFDLFGLQSGVPVIVPDMDFIKEKLLQAAAYTAMDERSVSDRMILLYKDENLRNSILQHAPGLLQNYDWNRSLPILEEGLKG